MTKDLTPKDESVLDFDLFFPHVEDESRLLVGCRQDDYSASMIARAVEDCNAQVLNLNVTSLSSAGAGMVVDLRVNHRNAEAITRSLARYGYDVIEAKSGSLHETEKMRSRANELLRYLEI